MRGTFEEQVTWAVEAGADFVIAETNDYFGEVLLAVEVVKEAGLLVVATFASTSDTTIDGVPFAEACARLEQADADVVGLNCSRGPATMLPLLEEVRAAVSCPIAAQPVPYRTTPEQYAFQALRTPDGRGAFPIELESHTCTRFEMADFAVRARDLGVGFIGILRWRAEPRAGDGRGSRPRGPDEPLLARPVAAPDSRR